MIVRPGMQYKRWCWLMDTYLWAFCGCTRCYTSAWCYVGPRYTDGG